MDVILFNFDWYFKMNTESFEIRHIGPRQRNW